MHRRHLTKNFFVVTLIVVLSFSQLASAQAAGAKPTPAKTRPGAQNKVNLLQVMQGILFPNSNVIFFVQSNDPAAVKPDADPTQATNPLSGTYGGWKAVENSSMALVAVADLLTTPGRMCSNGKPVPVQNADWIKFVQGLRDVGREAYKAGQAKNQDAFLDVSDKVTTACAACHDVYREKTDKQGGLAARCTK